jgi:phenylacetate-CoA ligase
MAPLRILKSDIYSWTKSASALRYRSMVEQAWSYDQDHFWHCQETCFRRSYDHARREVPYYRGRPLAYRDLSPSGGLLESLQQLPLLDKAVLRDHNTEFWSARKPLLLTEHRTSGSTGTPLRITASLNERALTQAILENWFLRLCGSRWPRTLVLSGFMTPRQGSKELFWRDPLRRNLFLNIYALGAQNRDSLIRLFRSFKPSLIYGYPSAVAELAHALGDALASNAPNVVAVLTAEVLHDHWREQIRSSLATRIYNLYGAQEGTHLTIECDHNGWHVMPLVGIVEIVDHNGGPVPAGQMGRVVVTSISKRCMPLIRYVIGDQAVSTGYARCPCGLGWPTMGRVDGRCEDVALARDGRRIGMLADAIIKRNQIGIREAQLIQRDYDRFDCRLVLDTVHPPDKLQVEAGIKNEMAKRLGYEAAISFAYVTEIPRGNRGKLKTMIVDFDKQTDQEYLRRS